MTTPTTRLKLLWISQNLPFPPKTGVLQRNYNLIREAARFADVHLVGIVKEDILPDYDPAVAEAELRKLCTRVDPVYLPIERSRARFLGVVLASLVTPSPFTVNWARSRGLRDTIAAALAATRFDAVYFDTISLAPYRSLVRDAGVALNHHNIESHLFERRLLYERHPLRRAYFRQEAGKLKRYEAAVGRSFDTHLVVSRLDGERLSAICPGISTSVIANGVDTEYFQPSGAEPERAHLVMASGMNWFPNRDAVLYFIEQIWPIIGARHPEARVSIVGASPPQAVLDLAARDARVTVTGFVQDVRPYLDRAQVYLCPMRDGGGTRLKILDSLSMGKAIVATTMALEGIDVRPETEVLVGDSPEAFAAQVSRIIADPELGRRLGTSARTFVTSRFAWPVIGDHLERTFRGIASGRPHA